MPTITIVLVLLGTVCMVLALHLLLPKTSNRIDRNRLMNIIGYSTVQKNALSIGWHLKIRDYLLLISGSFFTGYLIGLLTGNNLFVFAGGLLSFFVPKYIISMVRYRKRKEALMDLPHNLRLMASKFRDSKSLQKSLENSLPIMSGVTKSVFITLYRSLEIGIEAQVALKEAQKELNFRKFDDLCDKLIDGNRSGFTSRSVESIRETIDDIAFDIQILQDLDIQNRRKRFNVHIIVGLCWTFPFLFAYLESQITNPTIQDPIGKILLVTMFLVSLMTYLMRDKYLRLNLDDL